MQLRLMIWYVLVSFGIRSLALTKVWNAFPCDNPWCFPQPSGDTVPDPQLENQSVWNNDAIGVMLAPRWIIGWDMYGCGGEKVYHFRDTHFHVPKMHPGGHVKSWLGYTWLCYVVFLPLYLFLYSHVMYFLSVRRPSIHGLAPPKLERPRMVYHISERIFFSPMSPF